MAAADYFASGARPLEQQNSLYPPPRPQRADSSQAAFGRRPSQVGQYAAQPSVYPPPPYDQTLNHGPKPSVHFTPPASSAGLHRPSFASQARPDPYSVPQPNYQGQLLAPPQQGPYVPPGYFYQPQAYPPPTTHRPGPGHSNSDMAHGYCSDPESHRRKHRSRSRRVSDNSRSSATDGFLGAAGGGLIGDLIFPGLGTVGGALVGWVGGKDYGKHRKWREEKRDRDQERGMAMTAGGPMTKAFVLGVFDYRDI